MAQLLGGLQGETSERLGGELTKVVTSSVYDHNLAWHTDSTSWQLPNKWQILTLIEDDTLRRRAPTSILEWRTVLARLAHKQDVLDDLSSRSFPWREQFPELVPLRAPVIGEPPRWLRPALAPQADDSGQFSDTALKQIDRTIVEAEDFNEVTLNKSTIVVFDNHAVLHRGPHLVPDGGRTVLRIKLGGIIGTLQNPPL